jgi:hypothetical protein
LHEKLFFGMYAAARTIPRALLAIWAVFKRTHQELIILGILVGAIQFFDGFVGLYQRDLGKTVGPFILALLQFEALTKISYGKTRYLDQLSPE